MLSDADLAAYHRDGFVLVKGLIPRETATDALVALDRLLCARWPAFAPSPAATVSTDVHHKLRELARVDRPALAEVYNAIRKVASFWAIVGSDALLSASRQLLSSSTVGVAFRGCGIRLDLPGEDKWRSAWHQEYHSQMSSTRALTAWFSLVPVTSSMGPVELLPGSHVDGLVAVQCPDAMNTGKNYTETFVIPDLEERLSRYRKVSYESDAGDVLFLDFFTLHQSGYNRDPERSRISCQVRYFDMLHPSAVDHRWVGGWQDGGDFRNLHPDKVLP